MLFENKGNSIKHKKSEIQGEYKMRKLKIISSITFIVVLMMVFTSSAFSNGKDNRKQQPKKPPCTKTSGGCYALTDFPGTDFIIIKLAGQNLVTGIYRQCVSGADPGPGSADAVMVGSMQDVAAASAIPPLYSYLTQISLTGSVASGNFGFSDKAAQCWLHLIFTDSTMATGEVIGACGWFDPNNPNIVEEDDRFTSPITQVDCKTIPADTCAD